MIPFITTGFLLASMPTIIINKEHCPSDLRSKRKSQTELFIKKPQTFFGNMRKINVLFVGSGISCPGIISTLAAANAIAHVITMKNIPKQEDFVTLNKPDWEEMNRRLIVYPDIEYKEDEKNQSAFDFQKHSKRDRFRSDIKSQKLKTKHRRA